MSSVSTMSRLGMKLLSIINGRHLRQKEMTRTTEWDTRLTSTNENLASHPEEPEEYSPADDESAEVTELERRLVRELVTARVICSQDTKFMNLEVPPVLCSRLARDVCRVSGPEPCGPRGCQLSVRLQRADGTTIDLVTLAPSAVCTHRVECVLREGGRSARLLSRLRGLSRVPLASGYTLVKRKLFRSASAEDSTEVVTR